MDTKNKQVANNFQKEILNAMEKLDGLQNIISIFGGSREKQNSKLYKEAYDLTKNLSAKGYNIMSGGSIGIMEAANKGAKDANKTKSIGLCIKLPFEELPNPYQDISIEFSYFATRKFIFSRYSDAFIVFPGGIGTLDELFDIFVLIQTQKIKKAPIILFPKSYYEGIVSWIKDTVQTHGYMAAEDNNILYLANSQQEILRVIQRNKSLVGNI